MTYNRKFQSSAKSSQWTLFSAWLERTTLEQQQPFLILLFYLESKGSLLLLPLPHDFIIPPPLKLQLSLAPETSDALSIPVKTEEITTAYTFCSTTSVKLLGISLICSQCNSMKNASPKTVCFHREKQQAKQGWISKTGNTSLFFYMSIILWT